MLVKAYLMLLPLLGGATTEGYLCVAKQAAGFRKNESTGEWTSVTFRASGEFLVRPVRPEDVRTLQDSDKVQWVVIEIGASLPSAYCEDNFDNEILHCEGIETFTVNAKTLRFQQISQMGYTTGFGRDGSITPYMQIGVCSPI